MRAARREELLRTVERRSLNCGGRSVTTRMPKESGPNASSKEEKVTVPALRSLRETVTGCAVLMGAIVLGAEVILRIV